MIFLVCALKCEAECLINYFNLKSYNHELPFPLFTNGSIFLIVSGIGKLRAAAAVSYLYAISGEPPYSAWINIGIGGHKKRAIGEGCLAHQIADEGSGKEYHPIFTWKNRIPTERVLTVERIEIEFIKDGIYEMEAAGFCSAAFSVTISELIHCYKIISDNQLRPAVRDEHFVVQLMQNHLVPIEQLIRQLESMRNDLHHWTSVSEKLQPFIEKWHFTKTELFQLQRALQKWEALCPTLPIVDERILACKKAKDVLNYLDHKLLCFL